MTRQTNTRDPPGFYVKMTYTTQTRRQAWGCGKADRSFVGLVAQRTKLGFEVASQPLEKAA